MNHPSPSPTEIQSHLYAALLSSSTTDVALHVSGSWSAVYHVHRVVLIQSGFFHSLFTSGFAETPQHGKAPNKVDVTFDDENITRAVCLARLYGGGPPLFISRSLVPSPAHPLTPSFGTGYIPEKSPPTHHPATPRFLLSLLATAFYLSIPSLQTQAYSQILATIGPYTATPYLNFALGHRISDPDADEPEAAVGLEQLAHIESPSPDQTSLQSTKGDDPEVEEVNIYDTVVSRTDSQELDTPPSKCFHYGAISDKIGESVACWLTRWAHDLLDSEDPSSSGEASGTSSGTGTPVKRPRSLTFSSAPIKERKTASPCIFRRGGLSAEWISALVSSDTLFVKNEWERYRFAKRVVELRRKSGTDPSEEKHWSKMFSHGIFYVNMTNDELITVSQDRSPITHQAYVPLKVLQAASWDQGTLRHKIVSNPGVSPPSSPISREKEVGLANSTSSILTEISATATNTESQADVMYYPIPPDATCRYGDIGKMDDFPTSPGPEGQGLPSGKKPANRKNFFGIQLGRHNASECISLDATGKERWSQYPPFRFSIEFWDAAHLKEKSRLHSRTIWHAGSLFNVYVQIVRKKGIQLGVYLHRQSTVDPIPPISAPFSPVSIPVHTRSETWQAPSRATSPTTPSSSLPSSTFHYSPSIHPTSRSSTPNVCTPSGSSPLPLLPSLPAVAPALQLVQPYRDPRSEVSAYFSIDVSSAYGSSFTRFTSAPDLFKISQSWGWKSSASRTEEYLAGLNERGEPVDGGSEGNRLLSLRATIVVGII
ncbi:hypothetical protein BDV98DRAFT_609942 [Pterulicium gracile]|uniref:BTB domain-containing protein n=1 Tax=Pterulicium gracile TaxID=1884261 RepID=A0A5C3R0I1_9AGAR|nr:hypothetical protein BDV98DRAFT_609942 [Pterula gracilis]